MSALLPANKNATTQKIREAFSAAGFSSISKLPANLTEDTILRPAGLEEDSTGDDKRKPWVVAYKPLKSGLFHEFAYVPSKYTLAADIKAQEHAVHEARSHVENKKAFLPAGRGARLRHEGLFDEGAFPYTGDPYEEAQDQASRLRWIDGAKLLHGPFVPAGKGGRGAQAAAGRPALPDAIRYLHGALVEDWPGQNFSVLSTENDMVVVRFELGPLEDEGASHQALIGYMNVLAKGDRKLNEFGLRRHLQDWGREPGDGHILFLFRPPWVPAAPPGAVGEALGLDAPPPPGSGPALAKARSAAASSELFLMGGRKPEPGQSRWQGAAGEESQWGKKTADDS